VFAVALDRRDRRSFRLVCVDVNHQSRNRWEIAAELHAKRSPALSLRMTSQCFCMKSVFGLMDAWHMVDAVTDLGVGIGNELRNQALLIGLPGFARIVGANAARSGNGDVDAIRIFLVENVVWRHMPPAHGLPTGGRCRVRRKPESSPPILAAVGGFEKSGVFHAA